MTIHEAQSLDGFRALPGCRAGVDFSSLAAGTVLQLQTRRSHYRLIALDAPNSFLISGGKLSPEPVEARLVGATLTGGMIKTGWIGVGLRLEMRLAGERVITSTVEDVEIGA